MIHLAQAFCLGEEGQVALEDEVKAEVEMVTEETMETTCHLRDTTTCSCKNLRLFEINLVRSKWYFEIC